MFHKRSKGGVVRCSEDARLLLRGRALLASVLPCGASNGLFAMKPTSSRLVLRVLLFFLFCATTVLLPGRLPAAEAIFFLHRSAGNLTLGPDSPVSATGQGVSSGPLDRSGFVEVGVWTSAPLTESFSDVVVCNLHVWLGLRFTTANGRSDNSGNSGVFFDVRAEVLNNGGIIATGRVDYERGLKADPAKADEVVVPLRNAAPAGIAPGDVLV